MTERFAAARGLAREIGERMRDHRVSLAAGGLAFFVALSIAPAAIAFGTIAGIVLDPQDVRSALQGLIERSPGLAPLEGIVDPVASVVDASSGRAFGIAAVLGTLVAVYAASRVVLGTRMALDAAFERRPDGSGLLQRLAAAVGTLLGIVAAVAAVVAVTVVPRVLGALGVRVPDPGPIGPVAGWLGALVVAYAIAWCAYRFGPNAPGPRLRPLEWGAALAAGWAVAASAGVGAYVQLSSAVSATLAVFGGPMVVLLWLYLVFLGFLVGAELTAVLGARRAAR